MTAKKLNRLERMKRTFTDELEELGEAKVREKLIQGVWRDQKVQIAERWLAERERLAVEAAAEKSQKSAASARLAAWVAAAAAIIAAIATVYGVWPES